MISFCLKNNDCREDRDENGGWDGVVGGNGEWLVDVAVVVAVLEAVVPSSPSVSFVGSIDGELWVGADGGGGCGGGGRRGDGIEHNFVNNNGVKSLAYEYGIVRVV